MGNALYKSKKYEEAKAEFEKAEHFHRLFRIKQQLFII
jgi:hypothetical protein